MLEQMDSAIRKGVLERLEVVLQLKKGGGSDQEYLGHDANGQWGRDTGLIIYWGRYFAKE